MTSSSSGLDDTDGDDTDEDNDMPDARSQMSGADQDE